MSLCSRIGRFGKIAVTLAAVSAAFAPAAHADTTRCTSGYGEINVCIDLHDSGSVRVHTEKIGRQYPAFLNVAVEHYGEPISYPKPCSLNTYCDWSIWCTAAGWYRAIGSINLNGVWVYPVASPWVYTPGHC